MVNKKDSLIFGLIATAAACYLASVFIKKKNNSNLSLEKGISAFKEGKYKTALSFLLLVEHKDLSVLKMISEAQIKLGNFAASLQFIEKAIEKVKEISSKEQLESLVNLRYKVHLELGMNRESFKDLFLVNLLNQENKYKEKANEFLKKICINFTKTHKIEGMASKINYSDFFDTIFFLKEEQDPSVVFINSREFEKCYNFVFESQKPLHRFILGCFLLVNGNQEEALKIFQKTDGQISQILCKFLNSKKLTISEIEDLRIKVNTEEDPTVLFYLSKIFDNLGDTQRQQETLEKCNRIYPNACAISSLAVMFIKQKNHSKASTLIKTGMKDHPENINLICISLEYSLLMKDVEDALKTVEMSEKLFPNDPRLLLFKYMISEVLGNADISYLEKGIEEDPKYFKLYVYYGNTCTTGEESIKAYRAALESARSFDEIFTAYQLLIVVETQNELFKEFPELFMK